MRKYDIIQIFELLKTLKEVNLELDKNKMNYELVNSLITDIVEFVDFTKKYIANLVGDDSTIISLFNDYEKLVMLFREQIELQTSKNIIKKINKTTIEIENECRRLKPDKFEVLFLPYKASMADSLETIWNEAIKDPACDVKIMPIPYYENIPNRGIAEFNFEGAAYDKSLPLVDWQKYNIEEHRPDIIFTMNPYDECNLITSVHENFYSSKLKKYTDCLCYVPYFVSNGEVPKHFALLPGPLYADRVFVDSEKTREIYIDAIKEQYGNQLGDLTQKIVALGSPKFDKIYDEEKEDVIPEEWENIIKNNDGTNKKVVLYNTSIGEALKNGELYLEKIKDVINIFKQHKNAVLLWRPHPLLEATYRSMRPELASEYENIVESFKNEEYEGRKLGIFDESTLMHRAISISDAYYGDESSSVVALYKETDKPIMTQSVDTTLRCGMFIKVDDYYWFTAVDFNALFKMKISEGVAEYVGSFVEEELSKKNLFSNISVYKNTLIFIPKSADGIHFYNIETGEFSKKAIKEPEKVNYKTVEYTKSFKFAFGNVVNDDVYIFPNSYPAILKYNMISDELGILQKPIEKLSNSIKHSDFGYFYESENDNDKILTWCSATNSLISFDINSYEVEVEFSIDDENKYLSCKKIGNDYWIMPCSPDAKVVKVSQDYKKIEYIDIPKEFIKGDAVSFSRAIRYNNDIYMFPGQGSSVIRVDTSNLKTEIVKEFDINADIINKYPNYSLLIKFSDVKIFDKKIIAFNRLTLQMVEYDLENGKVREYYLNLKNNSVESTNFFDRFDNEKHKIMIKENTLVSLDLFLRVLCKENNLNNGLEIEMENSSDTSTKERSGVRIYNYIKGLVL